MTTSSVNTLVQPLGEMPPDAIVFGRTEAMQAVRDRLTKLASANVPVLIQGESGTGKDIVARMIHAASPVAQRTVGESELSGDSGHACWKANCSATKREHSPGPME